mmetsp:Transcript_5745/g.14356  ORF Transcript_5745/g.14356 Transcript_5745/m.14356 type:complete len:385 (+) Transcript_5745:118-1272(+)
MNTMEESTAAKQAEPVAAVTIDPAEKTAAPEAFRRQQQQQQQQHRQRQPLNLLQCMDKDGNIDAFRYIEYSRRRRLEFLKRADFICKMKSTLRMHHQHQQLLNRSSSMPGMTTMPAIPPSTSSMANEVFKTVNHSGFVSPETTPTAGISFTDELKSLGAGFCGSGSGGIKNTTVNKNNAGKNGKPTASFAMPSPVRLMARSVSMPFVASSFGTNAAIDGDGTNAVPRIGFRNEEFRPMPRQRLRKEEFEAAEALLFGMGRGPAEMSNNRLPRETAGKKRRGNASSSSSDENAESAKAGVVDGVEGRIETGCREASGDSSKKRKVSDPPKAEEEEALSRSEEAESAPSVVSTEDDSSGNIAIANNLRVNEAVTAVHGFCSPGKPK